MKGGVWMSRNDVDDYNIINSFLRGELSRKESAEKLGLTERAVTNRANKVRKLGLNGAAHGNRCKTPKNKKSSHARHRYLSKRRNLYADFNVRHAWEMIKEDAGDNEIESVSYQTFFRWCQEASLLKFKQRRRKKPRSLRDRMPSSGMMLQFDGSPHLWNGKEEWRLIYAIDDATSIIPAAEFHESETTIGCLAVLLKIIQLYGIPESLYIDRAGWSGGQKRQNFSQFDEACKALDIKLIYANSPQAKGRVERGNRTHQDRLIALLKHKNITLRSDANRYLEKQYIPEWNKKFCVEPTIHESRFRPLPEGLDLKEIICIKTQREARGDGCVSFNNVIYQVKTKDGFPPVKGSNVEFRTYTDNTWSAFTYGHEAQLKNRSSKPSTRS